MYLIDHYGCRNLIVLASSSLPRNLRFDSHMTRSERHLYVCLLQPHVLLHELNQKQ